MTGKTFVALTKIAKVMDFGENASDVYEDLNYTPSSMDSHDISETKVKAMLLVTGIILIPIFCFLGSIGNILSLCVLFHQRMRNQVNYVLAALCVSDTLFLIHCLIYTGLNLYRKFKPNEGESLRAHVYPIVGAYGSVVTARITSWLTLLLCAERFVAVYFPMRAKSICNNRNTCVCVGCIYVITMVLFIPLSLKYEAKELHSNRTTNNVRTIMATTDLFNNNRKFFTVYGTFLNILFRFAPLVLIPILNILMIRILHKNWKKRREMSAVDREDSVKLTGKDKERKNFNSNGQTRITIMLLTVSFIFLICILPGALNSIASHIWPNYSRLGKKKNLFTFVAAFTFLLETINSSVNFIIYMAMSRKFRLLYKEIFCCGHGQYLRSISVSSIRERFRWSTHKRPSERSRQSEFCRRTHSDVGLFRKNSSSVNDNVSFRHLSIGCDPANISKNTQVKPCDMNLFQPHGRFSLKNTHTNGCVTNCVGAKKHVVHSKRNSLNGSFVCDSKHHIFTKDLKNGRCQTCYHV